MGGATEKEEGIWTRRRGDGGRWKSRLEKKVLLIYGDKEKRRGRGKRGPRLLEERGPATSPQGIAGSAPVDQLK